jgi:D-sedoheptulose 7-phosphate isomerase
MTAASRAHVAALRAALAALDHDLGTLETWGTRLARDLRDGGRLLAAGNGGSAAQAEHLAAELVGRYVRERAPMSAIPLAADSASLTAIANDYGLEEGFARQVRAHGRPGDVLLALSTSGRSPNVLAAARAAHASDMAVWALTGRRPNPLAALADEVVCVEAGATATVQEVHMVALHLVCAAVDRALGLAPAPAVWEIA